MKKIIWFLILFFFVPTVLAKEKTLLGIGDSITTGYGVEEKGSYFSILCEKMQSKESVNCKNEAVNGMTTKELLEKVQTEAFQKQVKQVDYLVLSIGGNDYLEELSRHLLLYLTPTVDLTRFEQVSDQLLQNTESIFKEIKVQHPQIQLLIVPLYNPYHALLSKNATLLSAFEKVQADYLKLAQKYGFIPDQLSEQLLEEGYLNAGKDNIDPHPTAQGHALIAEELFSLLEEKKQPIQRPNYRLLNSTFFVLLAVVITIYFWITRKKKFQ